MIDISITRGTTGIKHVGFECMLGKFPCPNLLTTSTGSGRAVPDPVFPLLFHENPESRTFFTAIPNTVFSFPKNTLKIIPARANRKIGCTDWPFRLII